MALAVKENNFVTDHFPQKKNFRKQYLLNLGEHSLELGNQTRIMGVLNLSPDSFSHDGHITATKHDHQQALHYANKLIGEGADILDIGGESTRPGSSRISEKEEIDRILPTIKSLAKNSRVPISVDTYKPAVAKAALDAGAHIINNIMGVHPDPVLLKWVKNYHASIILMHIYGTPKTMQDEYHYDDLIKEIKDSLNRSIKHCLEFGISQEKILIDPGIGFGKSVADNLKILNDLEAFQKLNVPICIGTSRKSFIGHLLQKEVNQRLTGTIATVCSSIFRGAHIVRVHDIKAVKEASTITDAILNQK